LAYPGIRIARQKSEFFYAEIALKESRVPVK